MLKILREHFPSGIHYLVRETEHDEIDRVLKQLLRYPETETSHRRSWNPASDDLDRIGRRLGWVPHTLPLSFFFETVRDEVASGFMAGRTSVEGDPNTAEHAHRLIRRMGLTHLESRHPFSLSSGETRLVWFLCQWAKTPEYMVIENGYSGLSPDYRNHLRSFIDCEICTNDPTSQSCPTFIVGEPETAAEWLKDLRSKPRWKTVDTFPIQLQIESSISSHGADLSDEA